MIETVILYGALFWVLNSWFMKLLSLYEDSTNERIAFLVSLVYSFYCEKCFAFFITLILTLNPFIAAGTALTVYLIEKNKEVKL